MKTGPSPWLEGLVLAIQVSNILKAKSRFLTQFFEKYEKLRFYSAGEFRWALLESVTQQGLYAQARLVVECMALAYLAAILPFVAYDS